MAIEINPSYAGQRITTATGFKPVSEHNGEELVDLAIMAHRSRNPILLAIFDSMPAIEELVESKIAFEQAKVTMPEPDKVTLVPKKSRSKTSLPAGSPETE